MDYRSWAGRCLELHADKAVGFVKENGLENILTGVSCGFTGSLILYPGSLVMIEECGRYRLVIGRQETISTDRVALERALYRWAWDEGRLAA